MRETFNIIVHDFHVPFLRALILPQCLIFLCFHSHSHSTQPISLSRNNKRKELIMNEREFILSRNGSRKAALFITQLFLAAKRWRKLNDWNARFSPVKSESGKRKFFNKIRDSYQGHTLIDIYLLSTSLHYKPPVKFLFADNQRGSVVEW